MPEAKSADWHILGRGSIGLLWAWQLSLQKQNVSLIVKDQSDDEKPQCVTVTDTNGQIQHFDVATCHHRQNGIISHLVVPLKAYDVVPAIEQIRHRIDKNTLIILSHNGMGTIEPVQQLLGHTQPLLFVTTTHGAFRKATYHVVHTGLGESKTGWLGGKNPTTAPEVLNHLLSPMTWHLDIEQILWQKLAINCVINPLTALKQCRNGDLAQAEYQSQIATICREISLVTAAAGIDLDEEQLLTNSYKVIEGTKNNYSSMNRDIAGKRLTEIDFITGFLLQQGKRHGIDLPANQALFQQVKALEAAY